MSDALHHKLVSELEANVEWWEESPRHEAPHEPHVKWIPLINIESSGQQLGISADGWWVIGSTSSAVELAPGTPLVFLLPVLRGEPNSAIVRIREALRRRGLNPDLMNPFPVEQLVLTGLNTNSELWVRLALSWIKGIPRSAAIDEALRRVELHGPVQTLRQQARAILRNRQ